MSKKGGGFFEQAVGTLTGDLLNKDGNFFENFVNGAINVGLQGMTGGLVGYKDGQVGPDQGLIGKEIVKGVKVVTGAKAAEEANEMARKNFEQTRADAEAARLEQQNQTGRDQLRQSQMAGAARTTASSRANNRGTAIADAPLGDERDFLGL